jgi:hypothetical protein
MLPAPQLNAYHFGFITTRLLGRPSHWAMRRCGDEDADVLPLARRASKREAPADRGEIPSEPNDESFEVQQLVPVAAATMARETVAEIGEGADGRG